MAIAIVAPNTGSNQPAGTPALDAVELQLTPIVERDYVARGVFPDLRDATAAAPGRRGTSLHYLTIEQAQALLDDAEARREDARRGLKVAFNAHASNLRAAIEGAKTRLAECTAARPVCLYRGDSFENWRGTKEQLRAIGIALVGPYPGESGCKHSVAWTQDERGYKVSVTKCWPGLFRADIKVPKPAREDRRKQREQADAEGERLHRLKTLPSTPHDFRTEAARLFWIGVTATKGLLQEQDGYRFTDDAVEEFMEAASEAYWVIKNGEVAGRSPREKLQRALSASAKADEPLQRFLSSVAAAGELAGDEDASD